MTVYCVFSLESPQRGDSNEYTQNTISQYKKENYPKLSQICDYGICSKGLMNEFETAVVNEPSVFKPLKFYCKFKPNVHDFKLVIPSLVYLMTLQGRWGATGDFTKIPFHLVLSSAALVN